jgi:phage terminase large subunit-like protein
VSWDLSCPDWEARLRTRRSLIPDLPLNVELADKAVRAFNKLRLADVPGTPMMEEAGGEWFRDIVHAIFGAVFPDQERRFISELFLLVPKKNSKTTNGALLSLTAFLLNERPRARFALMAPVNDTAEEAYNAAAGAIALDEVLEKKLHVRDHIKTIVHRESKAELEIVTFDPEMLTGKKFTWALIDELHVIAKSAKASKAIRQVRGGMVPYWEAFLAFITTMPEEQPVGVMEAELAKARRIRDGKQAGPMLPVLYELPRDMQESGAWRDPTTWPLVTPNLGRSIKIEKLQELYDDAINKGEAELRGWASQHLDLEIGVGLMSGGWAGADHWEANGDRTLTLESLIERSEVVVVGIDGGGLDDLLGLLVLGRERETGAWLGWAHAWAHESVKLRRKEIVTALEGFEADGDLTFVQVVGQDVDEVAEIVCQVKDAGLLPEKSAIGVDPVGIAAIYDALVGTEEEPGPIDKDRILGVSQGWKMVSAIKNAERRLAGGKMKHDGSRLMAWCAGNARVVPAGNAVLITKQASGTAKIDPLMAMFDAVALMSLNPEASGGSFWERRA